MNNDTLASGPRTPTVETRLPVRSLGFGSIRGRALYVVLSFSLILIVAVFWTERHLHSTTTTTASNLSERHRLGELVRDLSNDIWLVRSDLERYMLAPNESLRTQVSAMIEHIRVDIEGISGTQWAAQSSMANTLDTLLEDLVTLRVGINQLMVIRINPEKLYPGIPVISGQLVPYHVAFYNAATLAMDDAILLQDIPAQREVYKVFAEARHSWTMMILSFRTYVAFRSGVFPGDPGVGMKSQETLVSDYSETTKRHLDTLQEMGRKGMLEFQQENSVQAMRSLQKKWLQGFGDIVRLYSSDSWRADVPILKSTIQPLFTDVWQSLHAMERALLDESTGDVTYMTDTASGLSRTLILISIVGIALSVALFFLIEYSIRRPIARVAVALKAEAHGEPEVTLGNTQTQETQALIEAFSLMREQVHSRQLRLETILGNAAEGIITFDENGFIESFNNAAVKLFGYDEKEAVGKDISMLIPPVEGFDKRDGYLAHFMRSEIRRLIGHEGEVSGRHKNGTRFPMAFKVSEIVLEGRPLYTGLVADISERKALVEHLKSVAEHDGLTGLYNRSYFLDELTRVVERARRSSQSYALLYIDLDNFKYVNDTLGHAAGDHLLIEIANLLNKRARKSDLIARLGGDEFTVLLYNISRDNATYAAETFRQTLADYVFKHNSERLDIGCSIGVAMINNETESPASSLSHADIACHLAKRGGRNRVYMFSAQDESSVDAMSIDMGWSRRIKEAIEEGRFALACQPIFDTTTDMVESFEVLVRMMDHNNEIILPGGFMPSAERFGLAVDIDKWVIQNAIETLAEQRATFKNLRYSLNLSGQTLSDPSVFALILDRLTDTGLDPSAITFEVTETVAIADMALAEAFLHNLKKMGCQTALDDFGSGLSSFAYLQDLPVDIVKIDGRFVKNLADNPVDQAMVRAMNDIAHALGKKTVAEFVENAKCYELLKEYGIDYAQGYHLGRPDIMMPCKAISEHANGMVMCRVK